MNGGQRAELEKLTAEFEKKNPNIKIKALTLIYKLK